MDVNLEVRYIYIPFISAINTSQLTCSLRCDYDILWKCSADEQLRHADNPSNYAPDYMPNLVFTNAKDGLSMNPIPGASGSPYSIQLNAHGEYRNFVRIRVEGTFLQHFDLKYFPFDMQTLHVFCTLSFFDASQVRFIPEVDAKDVVYVLTEFSVLTDWEVVSCEGNVYTQNNFTFMKTAVNIKRVSKGIVLRDFMLPFIVTLCSFSCFSTPSNDVSSRLSLLITLLLTLAALQVFISSKLPNIPSLTIGDTYILASFGFLFLIVWSVSYSGFSGNFGRDRELLVAAVSVYIAYHGVFAAWISRTVRLHKCYLEKRTVSTKSYPTLTAPLRVSV
jgi:hypothetical protein